MASFAAQSTSSDAGFQLTSQIWVITWLHAKPLDSAIGRVLAPYRPGGRHGHCRRRCVKHNTKHNF
jgi:hypothetical protein